MRQLLHYPPERGDVVLWRVLLRKRRPFGRLVLRLAVRFFGWLFGRAFGLWPGEPLAYYFFFGLLDGLLDCAVPVFGCFGVVPAAALRCLRREAAVAERCGSALRQGVCAWRAGWCRFGCFGCPQEARPASALPDNKHM
ncbi:hypothetical protein BX661DRAFT_42631 [Kickxella alabastrina]|uniref:uncharacterized protein n=1 Tax=Kickxella alabastrina TaxID=61397 RepID=UPI00221EF542|nr:uncharacterized protein BX661DRAFT_42631 [Kickxella alabastrina]KAI7825052.1 hypothetical protein BX661DRAFT_42631 [Kickxella alabastrina]